MRIADRQLRPVLRVSVTAGLLAPWLACGADSPASPAPDTSDDRIALSADGATLSGTNGGGGGSIGWLHNFDADTLAGVAVEHQGIANSQWTFGSVNGSLILGTGDARYGLYGEAHEGAGDVGSSSFRYEIEAVGIIGSYYKKLSLLLEDRRIDVLQSHGNLPKAGITYQWNPHISTSLSYAGTVSGNLGTRFTTARMDVTGPGVNYLAGAAFGQASPAVLNLGGISLPGSTLREGFVGLSKPFLILRGDLSVILDYIDLSKPGISDSRHATLTIGYIFHVGHR